MITSLPNLLTLSRILVIPALIAAFYLDYPIANWVALALFVGAAFTDFLDGHLARSRGEVSRLGRFLDPVADKLLVASVLLMLVHVDGIAGWTILPALIILCREILVSGLREYLAELRVGLPVSKLAKWKTVVQMIALAFLIVGQAGWSAVPVADIGSAGLWLAAALTLYTGYDYLRLSARHMTTPQPVRKPPAGARTESPRP